MKQTMIFVSLAMLLGSSAAVAQPPAPPSAPPAHATLTPDALKFGPPPPGLPPGAQVAVLAGDPAKAGEQFALRVKLPAGYKVPPHWHPADEHVTVLSGTLMFGMGDKFDASTMKALGPGSFAVATKEMRHYVQAKGETVIQVQAVGPFGINYVNAADDPRTTKPTN